MEQLMIELGKEYQTRSGRDVRIYAVDSGGAFPVHGAVQVMNGHWDPATWTLDGKYNDSSSAWDLIPKPKKIKVEGWVNVYELGIIGANVWGSPEAAKENGPSAIACIHICQEVTEGEGL